MRVGLGVVALSKGGVRVGFGEVTPNRGFGGDGSVW